MYEFTCLLERSEPSKNRAVQFICAWMHLYSTMYCTHSNLVKRQVRGTGKGGRRWEGGKACRIAKAKQPSCLCAGYWQCISCAADATAPPCTSCMSFVVISFLLQGFTTHQVNACSNSRASEAGTTKRGSSHRAPMLQLGKDACAVGVVLVLTLNRDSIIACPLLPTLIKLQTPAHQCCHAHVGCCQQQGSRLCPNLNLQR